MQTYKEITIADAIQFLNTKNYSCVKLDDFLERSNNGYTLDMSNIGDSFFYLRISFCLLLIYRISLAYKNMKKIH